MAHPCSNGHTWIHFGGTNCGCHPDAQCSHPVYVCIVCNDCDYGDNEEAAATMAACPDVEECKVKGAPYRDLPTLCLTRAEFDALDEYSATLPTGARIGKRWKRHDGAFDPACKNPFWLIGEYVDIGSKEEVGIKWYVAAPLLQGGAA